MDICWKSIGWKTFQAAAGSGACVAYRGQQGRQCLRRAGQEAECQEAGHMSGRGDQAFVFYSQDEGLAGLVDGNGMS